MAPKGYQKRGDVGERGGEQQEERGLGAESRAVATLHWVREELVQRHERRAAEPSLHGNRQPAEEPIASTQPLVGVGLAGNSSFIR